MDLRAPRSLGELNRLIAETPPLVAGATQAVLGESPLGALALVGKPVPVMKSRGETRFGERRGYNTVHPSMLLRIPDPEARREGHAAFLADLRRIRQLAHQETAMKEPKPGDHVRWDTPQGETTGKVLRKLTRQTRVKGHVAKATPEEPQFLVESDRTGAQAAHKPAGLKKR